MFKKPFSFEGRIARNQYALTYIGYIIIAFGISFLIEFYQINNVINIFYIPVVWILFAQGSKRCHDRGNSGIYQINPFYVIWMLFADSEIGDNEYGPNPKGIGNNEDLDDISKHLIG